MYNKSIIENGIELNQITANKNAGDIKTEYLKYKEYFLNAHRDKTIVNDIVLKCGFPADISLLFLDFNDIFVCIFDFGKGLIVDSIKPFYKIQ